jgi:undecaprenyl-diphosphatase
MSIIKAVFLGVIQGLTEFLPVSSSGHLVIFQNLLNVKEPGVLFEIMVHIGTLVAVIIYFRKDVYHLIASIFQWGGRRTKEVRSYQRLLLYIIIATVVTGILGIAFQDFFESFFDSLLLVGFMLLITGLILFISDRVKDTSREDLTLWRSLVIGFAQSVAIIPGISRSGATISTAIFTKLTRDTAARFSFLLSIPAILGAALLNIKDLSQVVIDGTGISYIIGGITAAFVSYFAIKFLLQLIKKARLSYFSIYCWIVGVVVIVFSII